MTARHRTWVVMLVIAVLAMTACGNEEAEVDLQDRAKARAAEARGYIDDLAARVGSSPEVRQDVLTECVPGQEDSGLDLVYTLHVVAAGGAADRLRGEIADHFAGEGWTVKHDPERAGLVSVRFQRGTFTMGAKVSEADHWAAVSGSGGCVR